VSHFGWYAWVMIAAELIFDVVFGIIKLKLAMLMAGFLVTLATLFQHVEPVNYRGKDCCVAENTRPKEVLGAATVA
jgi:hypothetical protein